MLVTAPILSNPILVNTIEKPHVFHVAHSHYDDWEDGMATAYYDAKDEMNGISGVTASGYDLDNGIYYKGYRILAADRSIPLGTLIDIKLGNGDILHGVVLDRGGAIQGDHFDIVMGSADDCFNFGKEDIQWQKVGRLNI